MENPNIDCHKHSLTIELSNQLYKVLQEKVKTTGKTEAELAIASLQQFLGEVEQQDVEKDRFAALEATLEKKLKQYVESLVKDRLSELVNKSPDSNLEKSKLETRILETGDRKSFERVLPIPTIRPLQIGDRVLVLEPDSPYYMAKVLVVRTSLIRATVQTDTGEKTFLKRDLRFVEASV